MPQTSHPKAACVRTVSTSTPAYQQPASRTTGGERRLSTRRLAVDEVLAVDAGLDWLLGLELGLGFSRLIKVRGAQRRPIINDREKLRVARVERKRPRMSSEKDLIRR